MPASNRWRLIRHFAHCFHGSRDGQPPPRCPNGRGASPIYRAWRDRPDMSVPAGAAGFEALTPDVVMDSAERALGRRTSGICRPLTSYINRVYEIGLEDGGHVIAKFYRPGRWSREALQDEHDFLRELAADEIPVVAPLADAAGATLHDEGGICFALFPRMGGRPCDEPSREEWRQIGRLIGRIHAAGARRPAAHRIVIDPRESSRQHLDFLRGSGAIPREVAGRYLDAAQRLLDCIAPRFDGALHGCHVVDHGHFAGANAQFEGDAVALHPPKAARPDDGVERSYQSQVDQNLTAKHLFPAHRFGQQEFNRTFIFFFG